MLNLSNIRYLDENVQVDNTCSRYLREWIGRPAARDRLACITHCDLMGGDKSCVYLKTYTKKNTINGPMLNKQNSWKWGQI